MATKKKVTLIFVAGKVYLVVKVVKVVDVVNVVKVVAEFSFCF
jgi:hypothetical protein